MPSRPISEVIGNRNFVSVGPATPVRAAAQLMQARHSSAVLVVDRNQVLVGIFTERNVVFDVVAEGLDPDDTQVGAVMTPQPQTISADRPFGHALHLMYEGGFRHVPVVDAEGRPLGVLSSRDAVNSDALDFHRELVQRQEITVIL